MLISPHAVSGATIGKLLPMPWLSVPIAMASHFALDRVPHWQETLPPYTPHRGTWVRISIDSALSFYLVRVIARLQSNRGRAVWLSALAGAAPDLDTLLMLKPEGRGLPPPIGRYVRWHTEIQRETASLWGLLPQMALLFTCIWLAKRR